ncbi:MAG: DNA replication/repair protein RecF [Bradymonadales bacterium]|jgi:DNA replication and repair protein RecF
MFIQNIKATHFRNLEALELEFSRDFNIIYGDNAQGKSNLLECLFFLAYLKGFRSAKLAELRHYDQPVCSIEAKLSAGKAQYELRLVLEENRRRIFVDNSPVLRLGDYLGIMRLSLFEPKDVSLLQNSPATRRNALDRMLFNHRPLLLQDLDQYQKVLRAKASSLRAEQLDHKLLDVYDEQLEHFAQRIIYARIQYLFAINALLSNCFKTLFDESYDLQLEYISSSIRQKLDFREDSLSIDMVWAEYLSNMRRVRNNERMRRSSLAGPQRDDWSIQINAKSAKLYASQGQQRAIMLSLKMAELFYLKQSQGISPILLLDDVSSELDPERNRRLFEFLAEISSQVFLTTTSLRYFNFPKAVQKYEVINGEIQRKD